MSYPLYTTSSDLTSNLGNGHRSTRRTMKRLKSLNSESVTAYQVIELQRMPSDPPAGFLQLVLGLGSGYDHVAQSLWVRNDSKLLRLS